MTIALAQEYLRARLVELGYGGNYYLRLRHYVLQPMELITIDADIQVFLLVQPPPMIRVQSDFGIYDLTIDHVNELQYEHLGKIEVENYASYLQHAQFIQVIIKTNDHAPDRGKI